jgi:hypothetical protein
MKAISTEVQATCSVNTMDEFIKRIYEVHKLCFHPDDSFRDYVDFETGKPTFTTAEGKLLDKKIDDLFENFHDDAEQTFLYSIIEKYNPQPKY